MNWARIITIVIAVDVAIVWLIFLWKTNHPEIVWLKSLFQ